MRFRLKRGLTHICLLPNYARLNKLSPKMKAHSCLECFSTHMNATLYRAHMARAHDNKPRSYLLGLHRFWKSSWIYQWFEKGSQINSHFELTITTNIQIKQTGIVVKSSCCAIVVAVRNFPTLISIFPNILQRIYPEYVRFVKEHGEPLE